MSTDKAEKITDIVDFNPKRSIEKRSTAPFIDMAALSVDSRDISLIVEREFNGGGSKFKNGDTLFARITPCLENGKTAKVSGLSDKTVAHGSTEFIVMAAKDPTYDEDYVYYLARLTEFRSYAQARMEGTSGRQRVSWQSLAEFKFDFPPKETRRQIGAFLKSIDDKIALNTQTNQTLEAIAQAIFKSWFVDFEPVKAKMAVLEAGGTAEEAERAAMCAISGKDEAALTQLQTEQPDAYAELAQTAALFPFAMQDSELGEIPEGWVASDLKSCATEIRRGISPKYTEDEGIQVVNQKCIRNHSVDFSQTRLNDPTKKKVDGREIVLGDVLVNSTGVGTLGRLAPVRYLSEPAVVDSHVTVVRANTNQISKSFLTGLMFVNEAYIESSGAGSTGQTELRKEVIEEIRFAKPNLSLSNVYESIVHSISSQIAELEQQKLALSVVRDTLLPKLLSGEIDLSQAADIADEASV